MTEHKTIKKAEDETTDIICILDRSTSIKTSGLVEKTIEGFNAFLGEQKKAVGKATLTLCLFDGGYAGGEKTYEIIHDRADINSIPELTNETYVPKGMTAMYDAIGSTIDTVYNQWKSATDKSDKVVVLIMTDGEENSSREYTQKAVFETIKKRQDEDKWAFVFIGANIDTMQAGGSMGVSKGNTLSYSNTGKGVNTAYMNMSASVSKLRSSNSNSRMYSASLDSLIADNGAEKEEELNKDLLNINPNENDKKNS